MAGASASWRAKSLPNPKSDGIPGILTMTPSGFKWTPNIPNAAKALNVDCRSLRGQRASKEATSKKAILNLLTDSTAVQYFFEFENFVDRDASRNFLANQASTSARPPGQNESLNQTEMERRIKLLQGDSELQRLHQNLVMNQILSEHDFWASRKVLQSFSRRLINNSASICGVQKTGDNHKMRTGMASTMLADIRPMADGRTNTVTFNITPEIIHQIFAEKPAVHRAFLNFVPSKMTEIAFWTKYCRNDYLHRTKNAAAATAEAQDDEELAVFVNDDDIIAKEYRRKIKRVDPTLDIAADNADSSLPGHGIYRDRAKDPIDGNMRNKLMRDINRHGEVVLEGRLLEENRNDAMSIAQALAKVQQQDTRVEENDRRARAMTELEDLQGPRGLPSVPLSIQDPRKYFDVQANTNIGASSSSTLHPNEILQRLRQQIEEFEHQDETAPIIPGSLAFKVLTELTQQVSSTHHSLGRTAEKNVLDSLPRSVREALLQHSSFINEVLRQFWATCPITSNALLQKANRLKDCMAKVYNEIQALKSSVQSEHRHQVSLILQPMFQTLDAALVHYEAEIEKRSAKKLGNGGPSEHVNGMLAVK
ncbi:general transcription and DNA repair factor IIH subunit TFB1-1 isoform X2 [Selaginella moellendorffii]|uniref:general transcription and DNA repair factor IIH subunit TFB1-1 isoform X2 n=1 Tax=Selaginella moellendorffii TaxID=88036 RepID=UPI000D1CA8B9|nr:general transcription and DNA repair factor IIH subunit TFB1-1 isoform X2 [Selaginella moellendorffii]|eukprot:XP_024544632.1 general transcription and DNA repair factor IIH subunit TFB1-1 isoform X2 [Selaginella moellendorffii]